MTDQLFRSHAIAQADRKADQDGAPVYMYRVEWQPRIADRLLRSPHGTEVPLVFGTKVPAAFLGAWPEVDRLSDQMMTAWLSFVHTTNPYNADMDSPAYDTSSRRTMIYDATCRIASDPDPVARDHVARGVVG